MTATEVDTLGSIVTEVIDLVKAGSRSHWGPRVKDLEATCKIILTPQQLEAKGTKRIEVAQAIQSALAAVSVCPLHRPQRCRTAIKVQLRKETETSNLKIKRRRILLHSSFKLFENAKRKQRNKRMQLGRLLMRRLLMGRLILSKQLGRSPRLLMGRLIFRQIKQSGMTHGRDTLLKHLLLRKFRFRGYLGIAHCCQTA